MRFVHHKLDGIICISRFLENYYSRGSANIVRIPPLVDLREKKWKVDVNHRSSNKVIKLIYFGNPGESKDRLDSIIQTLAGPIFSRIDFLLNIVGISGEEYEKKHPYFRENVQNLKDRVIFFGKMEHSDVIKKIKEMDFSIFIRDATLVTKAGFPTKFVESITCGIPVITNETSDLSEFLGHYKLGILVDASSGNSLSLSIMNALQTERPRILEMKKSCEKFRGFQYEEYLELMDIFIKRVLNKKAE
jgi:glycosyltransferase involved in cell wall biosynthesis